MLRLRAPARLKAVKELDAFPKIPESYQECTASGGTVSLICYTLISILVVSEVARYTSSSLTFKYTVDKDLNRKLKINVDITVAMSCDSIGADVLDSTNQNAQTFGQLNEEPAAFHLNIAEASLWESMQEMYRNLREHYHAIHSGLWKERFTSSRLYFPPRSLEKNEVSDSCRIHGTLEVNKVAGNFHIIAGKHIPIDIGHAHISLFMKDEDYNFSHRIMQFSFGDPIAGKIEPLEGDEKIASSHYSLYQYIIKVVPTEFQSSGGSVASYQYSVTEQERVVNHGEGSHGVPGIYFKYDLSAVGVNVIEHHTPFWELLVRLCGIVGGIYSTSGIISIIVKFICDVVTCKFLSAPKPESKSAEVTTLISKDQALGPLPCIYPQDDPI